MRVLLVVGGVLCSLTPLAGWWLAVQSTRPVSDILAIADRLDPSRLGDRLPVRGANDELDHLAETINSLLDDVARHFDRQHQFVADAAHELRSPLAAMQSSLEVALASEGTDLRESLEEVLEETRYLAKLTDGLLMLAESNAAPTVARTSVDLVGIARQTVTMFAGVGEDRGLAVRMTAPDGAVVVEGDAAQLRQVAGNLLDNAIRFTPAGGAVEVSVELDEAGPSLTVSDTGVGVASRHIPRLFDRFFKVDPARAQDGMGRSGGLGLPICKAIVERHGGTISMVSREGEGTTVTVRLPARSPPAPPISPPARHPLQTVAGR
jgi:signal transduction histidine kinase